jgi:phosphoribosylaminoimidazolecarboxamide formyltransferase / IMP cyclohydrolase
LVFYLTFYFIYVNFDYRVCLLKRVWTLWRSSGSLTFRPITERETVMNPSQKWALISVYNKTGIVEFARSLVDMGWRILASGGTAKELTGAGISVRDVATLVGGGAILKHRVVTLSREIHAGLLADRNDPEQVAEMEKLGLPIIDMMVCDFYPLRDAIAEKGATVNSVVELTDIGGPTMVRSAAKGGRIVVCRFEDRQSVLRILKEFGDITPRGREELRARAEFEVAQYCLASARFHSNGSFDGMLGETVVVLPKGENGYQVPAALYADPDAEGPLALQKYQVLDGAPLSYINYTDIDRGQQVIACIAAAWAKVCSGPYIAVGSKHGNPCGAAVGGDMREVVEKAATGNSLSMFGGVMICNFPLDEDLAHLMVSAGMNGGTQKFDSVIAPDFEPDAIKVFKRPKGRCRIVRSPIGLGLIPPIDRRRFRQVAGGFLLQPDYSFVLNLGDGEEFWSDPFSRDLLLAWAVAWRSNSNTVAIVKDGMLLGNGVGQQDRVGAAKLAVQRAIEAGHGDKLQGSSAASDSFFPQPDAPQVLIDAGVKAIFSTSGSINDNLTQALCAERGVKLVQLPDSEARGFFGH